MTVWNHSRKGRIEGEVAADHGGEWVHIKLTKDQTLRGARSPQQWQKDDIVTVRRSFLVEVPEPVAALIREGQVTGYSIDGEDAFVEGTEEDGQ